MMSGGITCERRRNFSGVIIPQEELEEFVKSLGDCIVGQTRFWEDFPFCAVLVNRLGLPSSHIS